MVLGDAEEDVGVGEKVDGIEREESGLNRPRFHAMNHRRVLGMVNDRRIKLGRSVSGVSERVDPTARWGCWDLELWGRGLCT